MGEWNSEYKHGDDVEKILRMLSKGVNDSSELYLRIKRGITYDKADKRSGNLWFSILC